jgi:hypothetical protein
MNAAEYVIMGGLGVAGPEKLAIVCGDERLRCGATATSLSAGTDRHCPKAQAEPVPFPKIQAGGIRVVSQNQRIIRCDVCDHPPACNVYGRSFQVAAPA